GGSFLLQATQSRAPARFFTLQNGQFIAWTLAFPFSGSATIPTRAAAGNGDNCRTPTTAAVARRAPLRYMSGDARGAAPSSGALGPPPGGGARGARGVRDRRAR